MELKGQPYFGVLTKRIPPLAVLFGGGPHSTKTSRLGLATTV